MRFRPGGPAVKVQWFFTEPSTKFLDVSTCFNSLIWIDSSERPAQDLGEVPFAPRPWRSGALPSPFLARGAKRCGEAAVWQRGGLPGSPELRYGSEGVADCCHELLGATMTVHGEAVVSESQLQLAPSAGLLLIVGTSLYTSQGFYSGTADLEVSGFSTATSATGHLGMADLVVFGSGAALFPPALGGTANLEVSGSSQVTFINVLEGTALLYVSGDAALIPFTPHQGVANLEVSGES